MSAASSRGKRSTKASGAKRHDLAPKVKTSKKISHGSKTEDLIKLLRRRSGASLVEMQELSGWQAHSVRGFLSGTIKKRLGHNVRSIKTPGGERRYAIVLS